MVLSFSLKPDLPSCNLRGKQAVNLALINNQACRVLPNIYVITNLFITNNYLFVMIRKIILINYFSEFKHQVAIEFGLKGS